jgi:hypothetical protein
MYPSFISDELFPEETDWRSCLNDNINEAMTLALLAEMEKYSEKPVIMDQRVGLLFRLGKCHGLV